MRIDDDIKLDFGDVLIRPKRSSLKSRKDVSLERTFVFKYAGDDWTGVPIMSANMDTVGTYEVAEVLSRFKMLTALHKHYTNEEYENIFKYSDSGLLNNLFLSVGTSKEDLDRITPFLNRGPINKIMVDVANGYSEHFIDSVKQIRDKFPDHIIAAGNVVTADVAEALILAGADIVKSGIGNGSVCSTRLQTGIGYPQLSAIIECADAVHGLGGHLIGDGGCNLPADFAKGFGGGADFIMSGSYFSGHDECGGTIEEDSQGNKYHTYYGMSSSTAQDRHNGGLADYRSSEGRTVKVPYKGPLELSVRHLLGGLRSTCTYLGANTIKEIPKRTTFIRVNNTHNRLFEQQTIKLT